MKTDNFLFMIFEVWMRFNSHRFNEEIVDFLSVETLEAIDYDILNLSNIEDLDLKEVFYFFEELLTL